MTAPLTDKIAQLEYVIREQMAEIDQLRAEVAALVDWIAGQKDALSARAAFRLPINIACSGRILPANAGLRPMCFRHRSQAYRSVLLHAPGRVDLGGERHGVRLNVGADIDYDGPRRSYAYRARVIFRSKPPKERSRNRCLREDRVSSANRHADKSRRALSYQPASAHHDALGGENQSDLGFRAPNHRN